MSSAKQDGIEAGQHADGPWSDVDMHSKSVDFKIGFVIGYVTRLSDLSAEPNEGAYTAGCLAREYSIPDAVPDIFLDVGDEYDRWWFAEGYSGS